MSLFSKVVGSRRHRLISIRIKNTVYSHSRSDITLQKFYCTTHFFIKNINKTFFTVLAVILFSWDTISGQNWHSSRSCVHLKLRLILYENQGWRNEKICSFFIRYNAFSLFAFSNYNGNYNYSSGFLRLFLGWSNRFLVFLRISRVFRIFGVVLYFMQSVSFFTMLAEILTVDIGTWFFALLWVVNWNSCLRVVYIIFLLQQIDFICTYWFYCKYQKNCFVLHFYRL